MTTEKLKRMIMNTLSQYGNRLNINEEQVTYILDLCDDNYLNELNKVIEAQNKINKIFIIALGNKRFEEIRQTQKEIK